MPATTAASWHQSLEEWAQQQFGHWTKIPHARPAAFAPFEAHRPGPFHALTVVMIVLSRRTCAFHRVLVPAIDLIRISMSAFRPALFTTTASSPAIAACDWVVKQCFENVLAS